MLPLEQLAILSAHLVHHLRSDEATEGAMQLVMDPHPGECQVVMSELRAVFEVQLVMAVTGKRLVHAPELPVDLSPCPPEFSGQGLLDIETRGSVRGQEAGRPLR